MKQNEKVRAVLARLGGVTKTAESLGLERMTVHYWLTLGIPMKHWKWIIKQGAATWEELAKICVEMLEQREKGKR